MGLSFSTWRASGYANAATAVPRRADPASLQQLHGQTMGTTWSLRFINPRMLRLIDVRAAVEGALARVIAQMSHWEHDSDIVRFNRAPTGSRHLLRPEFASVLACAIRWAEASGDAIDPTIGPLVACWGFGPDAHAQPPSLEELARARARTGWRRLGFDAHDGSLRQPGGMTLDLSGIAKGFAVDHGVDALRALGLTDLLFEIGGELRGLGRRPGGTPWQLQIEADAAQRVPLADMAIATSGDRWHRREHAGRHWSHTIDPRTGEPVVHALASVTVLHAQCMQADALATVLTVLGPDEGLAFAVQHDLAALFVSRDGAAIDASRARATHAWQMLTTRA
ncbi:FAD:protein FMN transferase [Variovorax sp. PBL-E5]|uniref:FAD:protein FMN transferase n=1 Tax=Variovorax sp. PBL-E5 TaxID=434014 RepID=UPI00131649D0|nr:FAD:protein FMN transferase [Variovorax sp. PBL-E5]VTU24424.1 Thiamine biosynthesis lipoprotein ApbE precursor [Variovorax sp. PBL-E5]